jgi:hypothetical protein
MRKYFVLSIVLLCGMWIISCGNIAEDWRGEIRKEINYAGYFWMHDNQYVGELGEIIDNDPKKIKEIIYFDAAPTDELDKSILAFYPSGATLQFVDVLTLCAERDGIDLATYGLSHPVTLDEVLNKRDEVWQLIGDLDEETRSELWQLK